jgi:hypothetical protein
MMKVIVYHRYYGCDTGCCGHAVAVFEDDWILREDFDPCLDRPDHDHFDFDHPHGDYDDDQRLAWAKWFVRQHLGEEHVADLDWGHCIISDD